MRTIMAAVVLLLLPLMATAQPWVPRDVEMALNRIQQAFRTADPASIEDMIPSGITMRLADSLYRDISSIQALDLLKQYFADKDSIDFHMVGMPGTGTMYYTQNGQRDTVNVDVWLMRGRFEVNIYALNISNYPTATVFFNIPRSKK